MTQRICLKCLDLPYGDKKYCDKDGCKLVEFFLVCECGEEIRPHFWLKFFPPWGREITNKHCTSCGKSIEQKVWDYVKILRKLATYT